MRDESRLLFLIDEGIDENEGTRAKEFDPAVETALISVSLPKSMFLWKFLSLFGVLRSASMYSAGWDYRIIEQTV